MFAGGGTRHIPELLEPRSEVILTDLAQLTLFRCGAAVPSWFSLHQDKLDVILDDGIRLIGLAQKSTAIRYFVTGIRDLMPYYWIKVIKADFATRDANVGVKWNNYVSSVLPPRQAYITYNTNEPATRNEDTVHVLPNASKVCDKLFIIVDMP